MATNNTITRRKYDRDYCQMANEFLKDTRLSWKAKGIIAYVQMLPDDWVLNMRDLTNRATDGRDSLYSGIKELEKFGYCSKIIKGIRTGQLRGLLMNLRQSNFSTIYGKSGYGCTATGKPGYG